MFFLFSPVVASSLDFHPFSPVRFGAFCGISFHSGDFSPNPKVRPFVLQLLLSCVYYSRAQTTATPSTVNPVPLLQLRHCLCSCQRDGGPTWPSSSPSDPIVTECSIELASEERSFFHSTNDSRPASMTIIALSQFVLSKYGERWFDTTESCQYYLALGYIAALLERCSNFLKCLATEVATKQNEYNSQTK